MMVRKYTYIFIDVEATLIRGKQNIIEIGAIKWLPDGTIEEFSQLIQPYKFRKLNAHIQKLTGISTEQLLHAPSMKQVMPEFMQWCEGDTILVAFGEFDRKVLEDELLRHRMDSSFLYPFVDFQQKYMIENQLKEQPSLSKLLETFKIETNIQHRALADAISLYNIFKESNGSELIEKQQTNEFGLLLSEFRQQEEVYDLYLTFIVGNISSSGSVDMKSIKSINEKLLCEVKEEQRNVSEGVTETVQRTIIHPSEEVETFLKAIVSNIQNKVLITRSGLKQLSKINRLHQVMFPKVETITLQQILHSEEAVNEFTLNSLSLPLYEEKLPGLLNKYEANILEEFEKRNLFTKEEIPI
ncbi:3'-5' exonuclease [Ureibacillus aquaedulcis]|uniref:3'-5' exonuclease n=1 Tax=Ureibacillus aquaedulcis TaxID=3058421 RepID=A0ABT8GQV1_9BACL|nr:3'-5' exonuclease [Ureibacillus sp. BA0131]MDN4493797.1 3'-5' exonuclease [Ureibacillus sp. BA0131]